MQTFFLPMTRTCLPNIVTLSRHFAAKGWPQYFTQHGHPESDFEEPVTNQLVKKWGVDGCLREGMSGWELIREVGDWWRRYVLREGGGDG
jgi:nicotinamidase-related amidase